jgi:hypothetical protein
MDQVPIIHSPAHEQLITFVDNLKEMDRADHGCILFGMLYAMIQGEGHLEHS